MNKVGGPTLPDFKVYQKAAVIKTVWFWHKDRTDYPETNPVIYSQSFSIRIPKSHQWDKE